MCQSEDNNGKRDKKLFTKRNQQKKRFFFSIRKVPPEGETKPTLPSMKLRVGKKVPQMYIKSITIGKSSTYPSVFWNWAPVSMDMHPAPPPNPYPFGPYFLPWQFLQYNSASCSAQLVESKNFPHIPKIRGWKRIAMSLSSLEMERLKLTAFETSLVEFVSTGNTFFSCID